MFLYLFNIKLCNKIKYTPTLFTISVQVMYKFNPNFEPLFYFSLAILKCSNAYLHLNKPI